MWISPQFKKVNFNVRSEWKLENINITSVPWRHWQNLLGVEQPHPLPPFASLQPQEVGTVWSSERDIDRARLTQLPKDKAPVSQTSQPPDSWNRCGPMGFSSGLTGWELVRSRARNVTAATRQELVTEKLGMCSLWKELLVAPRTVRAGRDFQSHVIIHTHTHTLETWAPAQLRSQAVFLEPADKCSQGWPVLGFPCATICLPLSLWPVLLGLSQRFQISVCVRAHKYISMWSEPPKLPPMGLFLNMHFLLLFVKFLLYAVLSMGHYLISVLQQPWDVYHFVIIRCPQFTDALRDCAPHQGHTAGEQPKQNLNSEPRRMIPARMFFSMSHTASPPYVHMRAHMHACTLTHTYTYTPMYFSFW